MVTNYEHNHLTRAARLVSVVGHPFVLLALTVFIAAVARDGAGRALTLGLVTIAATALPLLLIIRRQVAKGAWSDHDVSVAEERRSFYPRVLLVVAAAALVFYLLGFPGPLVAGLGVSLALLVAAMIINRRTKISLHMIFAVYFGVALTAVGLPIGAAFLLLAAAVGWSRVRLARHTPWQVAAGAALGAAGGLVLLAVNGSI